jgi:hypothetical protein
VNVCILLYYILTLVYCIDTRFFFVVAKAVRVEAKAAAKAAKVKAKMKVGDVSGFMIQ